MRSSAPPAWCDPGRHARLRRNPARGERISWVHDNAMSDLRYLPETMGPGCAFLDYDNDGWMDIYLVNSGPSRFLQAEEADPQRALQEQSRRHIHRCDREGRRGRADLSAWASRPAITITTAFPTSSSPLTGADSVPQQRQRNVYRRQREGGLGAEDVRRPLDHQRRLVRLRQ